MLEWLLKDGLQVLYIELQLIRNLEMFGKQFIVIVEYSSKYVQGKGSNRLI